MTHADTNQAALTALFDRLGTPARMQQIARYDLFAPELRTRLDAVTTETAARLSVPVSLVSVILDNAQYLIGAHGVGGWVADAQGTPAEWALCTQTVLTGRPYCVNDGRTDPAQGGNPLLAMTGLRSYAGVPLIDESGHVLGAHCGIDAVPRTFTNEDLETLHEGAATSMRILREYRTD